MKKKVISIPFLLRLSPVVFVIFVKKNTNIKITTHDDLINPLTKLYPWQSLRAVNGLAVSTFSLQG